MERPNLIVSELIAIGIEPIDITLSCGVTGQLSELIKLRIYDRYNGQVVDTFGKKRWALATGARIRIKDTEKLLKITTSETTLDELQLIRKTFKTILPGWNAGIDGHQINKGKKILDADEVIDFENGEKLLVPAGTEVGLKDWVSYTEVQVQEIEKLLKLVFDNYLSWLDETILGLKSTDTRVTSETGAGRLLPSSESDQNETLKRKLTDNGFFNLPDVIRLNETCQQGIMELIIVSKLPYQIALFEVLGFFTYLKKNKFQTSRAMQMAVSAWLQSDKDGRNVRGNITSFLKKEASSARYTAWKQIEKAKEDLIKLN